MTDPLRVWVIRANDGRWAETFATNGYIGLHHGMDGVDMSGVRSRDEVRRMFELAHPDEDNERSIANRSSQVARFHLEIRCGDGVLTPGLGGEVRCGRFVTDDSYYVSDDDGLPCRNRRSVEWSSQKLNRQDLPRAVLQGGTTLYEVDDPSGLRGIFGPIEPSRKPGVWIVRGGRQASAVEQFIAGGYTGIGFNLQQDDLSLVVDTEGIKNVYLARNPDGTESAQILGFCLNMEVGDYVLMPGPRSQVNYFGKIKSDLFHDARGPYENRRNVEWSEQTISREELDLSGYRPTVTRPKADIRARFFEIIGDGTATLQSKMPEDSWVAFHLELGQKLIDEAWWSPEKRLEMEKRIDAIRWADPADVGDDYEYERWTGDPFSFYLSFNLRSTGSMRVPGYEKVKELFVLDEEVPNAAHIAAGYGVHGAFGKRPSGPEIETLWEFFRLVYRNDPIEDSAISDRFVEYFDRLVAPSDFVGLRNRKLSYWLYWIDPTRYMYIEQLNKLRILAELGLGEDADDGQGYLRALAKARDLAFANGCDLLDLNRWGTTRESLGSFRDSDEATFEEEEPSYEIYTIENMLADGVFLVRGELERMLTILRSKRNLILQGPPGVGKTFIARKLAYVLMGEKGERTEKRITSVQFHQSYSYEDFVGGFRPHVEDRRMVFTRQDGPFMRVCEMARDDPDADYVVLIDEINRGNLSRVFGELLMLIEADKRKPEFGVNLQHRREDDEERFFVPPKMSTSSER